MIVVLPFVTDRPVAPLPRPSGIPDLPDMLFDIRLEAAVSAVNRAQGIDGRNDQ